MKIEFHIESGQPKVNIDGEWNALSLFLESDSSSFDNSALRHIELKKTRQWMGNASTINLISGNTFEVSTELDLDLNNVKVSQKQLITLINKWSKFEKEKTPFTINV